MGTNWPKRTGEVAKLIGATEVRISSLIRLGKVNPPMLMGRRAWDRTHALTAAKVLGLDSCEVRNECSEGTD